MTNFVARPRRSLLQSCSIACISQRAYLPFAVAEVAAAKYLLWVHQIEASKEDHQSTVVIPIIPIDVAF